MGVRLLASHHTRRGGIDVLFLPDQELVKLGPSREIQFEHASLNLREAQVEAVYPFRRCIPTGENLLKGLEDRQRIDTHDVWQIVGVFVDDLCILLGQAEELEKSDDALESL